MSDNAAIQRQMKDALEELDELMIRIRHLRKMSELWNMLPESLRNMGRWGCNENGFWLQKEFGTVCLGSAAPGEKPVYNQYMGWVRHIETLRPNTIFVKGCLDTVAEMVEATVKGGCP